MIEVIVVYTMGAILALLLGMVIARVEKDMITGSAILVGTLFSWLGAVIFIVFLLIILAYKIVMYIIPFCDDLEGRVRDKKLIKWLEGRK